MLRRLWRWIARLWRADATPLPMIDAADLAALREAIAPPFDWLKEYGPLWTPEGGAFWLAPTTPDQLAAWWTKYRPGELGWKVAYNPTYAPVSINIEKLVVGPLEYSSRKFPWQIPLTAKQRREQSQQAATSYQQAMQQSLQHGLQQSLQHGLHNAHNAHNAYQPHRTNPMHENYINQLLGGRNG